MPPHRRRTMWITDRSLRLAVFATGAFALVAAAADTKPKITKADDLPRHVYPVKGTVTELVTSPEAFAPFHSIRCDPRSMTPPASRATSLPATS